MIRRNRKKRMHGFVLPAPYAGLVVAGAVLALAYVWLSCRCDSLGRDIRGLESEKAQLKKELQNEESRWAKTKSPGSIETALAKYNIVMTWPRQDQVVRLYESRNVSSERTGNSLTYIRREKAVIHD